MQHSKEIDNLLNGTTTYSRLLEFNNHLSAWVIKKFGIANLRNYKKGAATVVVPIELPGVELVQGAEK